jgi:hypothetical protein
VVARDRWWARFGLGLGQCRCAWPEVGTWGRTVGVGAELQEIRADPDGMPPPDASRLLAL